MDVSDIKQPDIHVFGFRIQEPMTSLTDFIITALCFYIFYQLLKKGKLGMPQVYMKYHFLTIGIAAFIGGLFGHAILYMLNDYWRLPGWYASMVSVMFMERAAIEHARGILNEKVVNVLMALNVIEFLIVATLTAITIDFKWVEIHSIYGVIAIVVPFHILTYTRTKNKGSKLMLIAIALLVLCLPIFNTPIILHTYFNHKDLAHLVIMISEVIMFMATLSLPKKEIETEPLPA